jgi:hypothetical protein
MIWYWSHHEQGEIISPPEEVIKDVLNQTPEDLKIDKRLVLIEALEKFCK